MIEQKEAGKGLIIAGWIFSIVGGIIGLAIASSIAFGKVKDENGNKVPSYTEESRKKGKTMFIVACICTLGWIIIRIVSQM